MNKNLKHFFYTLVVSVGVLYSAHASTEFEQQEISGQQIERPGTIMAQSKIINIADLFEGKLSKDDLKEINNDQIKSYIVKTIINKGSISGNLLGVVNELAAEGYINKIMDKKTIEHKGKKGTFSFVKDFEILEGKEAKFKQYFVNLHSEAIKYNEMCEQEGYN